MFYIQLTPFSIQNFSIIHVTYASESSFNYHFTSYVALYSLIIPCIMSPVRKLEGRSVSFLTHTNFGLFSNGFSQQLGKQI